MPKRFLYVQSIYFELETLCGNILGLFLEDNGGSKIVNHERYCIQQLSVSFQST